MSYVYFLPPQTPTFAACRRDLCVKAENGPAWALTGAAIVLGAVWIARRL